jgi:hypothetical protein
MIDKTLNSKSRTDAELVGKKHQGLISPAVYEQRFHTKNIREDFFVFEVWFYTF